MVTAFMHHFGIKTNEIPNCHLCFGDFSCWGHGTKFAQTSIGSELMNVFRLRGFHCYYIHEARTSMMCCNCRDPEGLMQKFRRSKDFKVKKSKQTEATPLKLVHGLVRCKKCKVRFDRDVNAASNIWILADAIRKGLHDEAGISYGKRFRPLYLRYQSNRQDDDEDAGINNQDALDFYVEEEEED